MSDIDRPKYIETFCNVADPTQHWCTTEPLAACLRADSCCKIVKQKAWKANKHTTVGKFTVQVSWGSGGGLPGVSDVQVLVDNGEGPGTWLSVNHRIKFVKAGLDHIVYKLKDVLLPSGCQNFKLRMRASTTYNILPGEYTETSVRLSRELYRLGRSFLSSFFYFWHCVHDSWFST